MTCHDARELFSDLTDDVLTAAERASVDAHLAACADCRKELERFRATVGLLRRLERPRAPAAFVDRVLAAARPAPWYRQLLRRLFLPLTVKLPAEVAALLLVAGLAVFIFERTPDLQQAARQESPVPLRLSPRPSQPPPVQAPAMGQARGTMFRNGPAEADRNRMPMREPVAPRAPAEGATGAPGPAPAAPPAALESRTERAIQPALELRKGASSQGGAAPEESASSGRPAPERRKILAPATPPASAPRDQGALDAMNAAKAQGLAAPAAPEGRADSEKDKLARSPARAAPPSSAPPGSLPSPDVVGQLTVKDRPTAQEALITLLARSGGVVMSRRSEGETSSMLVAVPRTAYPEFSQGLAHLGAWHSAGEPSELPSEVRVLLHLVEADAIGAPSR